MTEWKICAILTIAAAVLVLGSLYVSSLWRDHLQAERTRHIQLLHQELTNDPASLHYPEPPVAALGSRAQRLVGQAVTLQNIQEALSQAQGETP